MTNSPETERFLAFFEDDNYIEFKNYIYSYILRKIAINRLLKPENLIKVLELGSGLSPLVNRSDQVIYSDLSFDALNILRKKSGKGLYVVADAANSPFKSGIFSHIVCSEVLEHIANDIDVIKEAARIMRPSGRFIITFPHRKAYFAHDDRFVGHLRRYELSEMIFKLQKSGFQPFNIKKVLGPVDKVTICLIIYLFSLFQKTRKNKIKKKSYLTAMNPVLVFFKSFNFFYSTFALIDAWILPSSLSTVLLIQSRLSDDIFLNE